MIGDEPVPPRRLQPKTPRDLETICLKCLQKEAKTRYASAADLAEDLRRFQAGEPIAARPVGVGERLWRWAKRRPVLAGLGAAVVLLLTTLAVGTGIAAIVINGAKDKAVQLTTANQDLTTREHEAIQHEKEQHDLAEGRQRDAQREELLALHHKYSAQINLTETDWQDGDIASALERLEKLRPRTRKAGPAGIRLVLPHACLPHGAVHPAGAQGRRRVCDIHPRRNDSCFGRPR